MLQLTGGRCQRSAPRHTQHLVFAESLPKGSGGHSADLMAHGLVVSVGADDLAMRESQLLLQAQAELDVGKTPVMDADGDQAFLACSSEESSHLEPRDAQGLGDVNPRPVLQIVRPSDGRHERPVIRHIDGDGAHLSADITSL